MSAPLALPDARLRRVADLSRWTLAIDVGASTFEFADADFAEAPEFSHGAEPRWNDGIELHADGAALCRLVATRGDAPALLDALAGDGWRAPALRLGLRATGEPAILELFAGALTAWSIRAGIVELRAERGFPWEATRLLCRDLADLAEGKAVGVARATWLPQVFGENEGVPCAPLFRAESVRTAAIVDEDDATVLLAELPAWPRSGRVQLNDEIVAYGQLLDGPPRLAELARSPGRWHARGTRVHPLPATGNLAWIAADHGATVPAVFAGAPDGSPVSGHSVAARALSGRTATAVELPALPVERTYDGTRVEFAGPWGAGAWSILPETQALFAFAAFREGGGSPGAALFSAADPVLYARWKLDLSRGSRRHDRIERLRLAFRVHARMGWGAGMRFTVSVARGGQSVSRIVRRNDLVFPSAAFEGTAVVPGDFAKAVLAPANRRRVLDFDEIDAASLPFWSNAADAIASSFHAWASRIEPASAPVAAPLRARIRRDRGDDGERLARVGLRARVRASAPTDARLAIFLPGYLHRVETVAVDEQWRTVGIDAEGAGAPFAELANEFARFEIALAGAGAMDVAGLWIEADTAPPSSVPKAPPAPLAVEGRVDVSPLPGEFELDVTALLDDGPGWEFLSGTGAHVVATFALAGASLGNTVELNGVRWLAEVSPARSVAATDRLYATVRGRATQADGHCNPGAVLDLLLRGSDFAALPDSIADAASLAALVEHFDGDGRRFRAWFAEERPLDGVLRAACAEAGALPAPAGWRWVVQPLDPVLPPEGMGPLDESQALEFPGPVASAVAPLRARRLAFASEREGVLLAESARPEGEGRHVWRTTWLARGHDRLAAIAFDLFGRPTERLVVPVRTSWIATAGWSRALVHLPASGVELRSAAAASIVLRGGRATLSLALDPRAVACAAAGPATLRVQALPALWQLVVDGVVVARCDRTNALRIAGRVREGVAIPPGAPTFAWDVVHGRVVFSTPDAASAFAIAAEGDLLLPGRVVETADIAAGAPTCGMQGDNEGITLGSPQLGAFARFDAATGDLLLKGRTREMEG